jgi:hypothetical protein
MIGGNEPFDALPFFWNAHYDTPVSRSIGRDLDSLRSELELETTRPAQ